MTLVASWVRRTPSGSELVVASDSRLSGGITLDYAPKIFRLERNDAVLAYCGTTLVAYPLILQIKAGIDGYEDTRNRIIDIVQLKSHIEKTIEELRKSIPKLPNGEDTRTSFQILLAGYSWRVQDFRSWIFRFDLKSAQFNAFEMSGRHRFQFMSDRRVNELRASRYVMRSLRESKGPMSKDIGIGWTPLKAVIDAIHDESIPDVGGPPQIVKIYRHSNSLPMNVLWPRNYWNGGVRHKEFGITHLGRTLLGYERTNYLTLDPTTWDFLEPWRIRERLDAANGQANHESKQEQLGLLCRVLGAVVKRNELQREINLMVLDGRPFSQIRQVLNERCSS